MANVVVTIDNSYDSEVDDAFLACYANPDGLTGRQLVELHCANLVKACLNSHRTRIAIETAEANVTLASDLTTPEV